MDDVIYQILIETAERTELLASVVGVAGSCAAPLPKKSRTGRDERLRQYQFLFSKCRLNAEKVTRDIQTQISTTFFLAKY